ncbi:MAG: hypothetical protein LBL80_03870 [Ruminococcus sp.]|nr:hypothetical protein [Ruminococcus sp.]
MNISPENIDKYKQDMMKMYRGSASNTSAPQTRSMSQSTSNMTAARNLASNVPQMGVQTAPQTAQQIAPETVPQTAQQIAPQTTQASEQPLTIPSNLPQSIENAEFYDPALEAEADIYDAQVQNHGTPAYIPDTGYIEVPNFPGIPDTGPAAAPEPTPAPKPPDQKPPAPPAPKPPQPPVPPPGSPGLQVPDTGYIEVPQYQTPDTGYIEAPAPGEAMGYLRTQVYASNRAIPIEGALVLITEFTDDGRTNLVRMLVTDESGYTETVPLPVPVYDLDRYPAPGDKPFRDYRMSVYKEGYYIVPDVKIPIFAGVKSLQPIQMVPLRENEERVNILPKEFADAIREKNAANEAITTPDNNVG